MASANGPPLEPEIGGLIAGKYRLIKLLGRGGMGAVYEAEHEQLEKRVAVKVLLPALARSPVALARFAREARAAAATGHPSVIRIFDFDTSPDGHPYIVMELLQGRSLGDELLADGVLSPIRAVRIAREVLSALGDVHSRGLLHRDIKPQNIFILEQGPSALRVKLLDFGAAKVSDDEDLKLRLTKTGVMVGTPSYMAPEQITASADLDGRVDLWALSVVLYLSLTGVRPFRGDCFGAIAAAVLKGEVIAPSLHRPGLPDGLDEVILKGLALDAKDRYPSPPAMSSALEPFAAPGLARHATIKEVIYELDDDTLREDQETTRSGSTLKEIPAVAPPSGTLVALDKKGRDGEVHHLPPGTTIIGRTEGEIQVVFDPHVSPRHAELAWRDGKLYVKDLGSTNGVFVTLKEPHPLTHGDHLVVGQQLLRFEVLDEPVPLSEVTAPDGTLRLGTLVERSLARLCQLTSDGSPRDVYHVGDSALILGRQERDVVFPDDPFMSRRHARISFDPATSEFTVEDLASFNGTSIRVLGEHELDNGDRIRVGDSVFRLEISSRKG